MLRKTILLSLFLLVLFFSCKETKKEKSDFKIGIVFDIGGRGDNSFNDSAYAGLVDIAKTFEGYIKDDPDKVNHGSIVELKYLEPKEGGQDREQLLRLLSDEDYNLIFGVGFMFRDAIEKVAKDYPETHFALIDGYIPDLVETSNITCIDFKEHEGSFMVGAIAGLLNQGGKVGFIGGMDIPLIHKFEAGFFAGAMYINEELRKNSMKLSQYIGKDPGAFTDAPSAYNIASSMYKQGTSIIYHASGASGDGLFQAAEEYNKLSIGVDSDQGLIYASSNNDATKARAKFILTSCIKRVDNAVFVITKELIEKGKLSGGYHSFGIKDDGVGYALNQYNEEKIVPIKDKLEEIKQLIIDGAIVVPDHDSKLKDWITTIK